MRSSFKSVLILVAAPLAGMTLFFLWQWFNGGITPPEVARETSDALRGRAAQPAPPARAAAAVPPPASEEAAPVRPRRPKKREAPIAAAAAGAKVVLIIDDLGFDGQPLDRVMALDPDVSFSILPNGPRASDFAARLAAKGFEVLCHLPMEPRGNERPGANAILTSMSDEEIASTTVASLAAVPNARGVNNHMGSLATTDRRVMESVLRAMPAGMFFIDSRTTGRSIAADVAKELSVPTATRHVFLDDIATEAFVRKQLVELAGIAGKRGVAIGIGHPYPSTLRVLEAELPALRARGIDVVRASEVVR